MTIDSEDVEVQVTLLSSRNCSYENHDPTIMPRKAKKLKKVKDSEKIDLLILLTQTK